MADRPPKLWAILIGIDEYPSTKFDKLSGCLRDVSNTESILRENFNDSLEILKVTSDGLNDGLPTYDNILEKFNTVTNSVRPGDFVYFHYSGHGGRQLRSHDTLHPPSTTPGNKYIECLVLHGDRHLRDYELGRLFDKLADAKANLFAVLDCCHSGSGDRGGGRSIRQIDHVLPAYPHPGQSDEEMGRLNATDKRAGSRISTYWTKTRDYTILTACQPNQYASECRDEQMGALTLTLLTSLEALRQSGYPLTYKTLFCDIRARIGLKATNQHPKLFGIEDREVFSHGNRPSTRQAVVNQTRSKRVYIDQGEIHGVKVGESWNIYPRGELQPTVPITEVTIDQVMTIQSSARLPDNVVGVDRGCPASIATPMYGESLQVAVEDSALRQLLAKEPPIGVEFREPGYRGAVYVIRATTTGEHQVVDASGTPLSRSPMYNPGQTPVSEMHAFLRSLAHYWRVLNLRSTSRDLCKAFSFAEENGKTSVLDGDSITLKLANVQKIDPEALKDLKENEINNRYSLYFTVLNLRTNGTVVILFPSEAEGHESDPLGLGETRRIPLDMGIPEESNASEITDIFKVIVTNQPASFSNLATQNAIRGGSLPAGEFNKNFRDKLGARGNRGYRDGTPRIDVKWQTAHLSVTVARESME
ncbi:caspase domain-containing protein [Annulohypoxylon nitens]|nr:caspase domain-containing protein [Annulohypoxylon nitens]